MLCFCAPANATGLIFAMKLLCCHDILSRVGGLASAQLAGFAKGGDNHVGVG